METRRRRGGRAGVWVGRATARVTYQESATGVATSHILALSLSPSLCTASYSSTPYASFVLAPRRSFSISVFLSPARSLGVSLDLSCARRRIHFYLGDPFSSSRARSELRLHKTASRELFRTLGRGTGI